MDRPFWSVQFGPSSLDCPIWTIQLGPSNLDHPIWTVQFGPPSTERQPCSRLAGCLPVCLAPCPPACLRCLAGCLAGRRVSDLVLMNTQNAGALAGMQNVALWQPCISQSSRTDTAIILHLEIIAQHHASAILPRKKCNKATHFRFLVFARAYKTRQSSNPPFMHPRVTKHCSHLVFRNIPRMWHTNRHAFGNHRKTRLLRDFPL